MFFRIYYNLFVKSLLCDIFKIICRCFSYYIHLTGSTALLAQLILQRLQLLFMHLENDVNGVDDLAVAVVISKNFGSSTRSVSMVYSFLMCFFLSFRLEEQNVFAKIGQLLVALV